MVINFQNSFTFRLSSQFATKSYLLNIAPHLKNITVFTYSATHVQCVQKTTITMNKITLGRWKLGKKSLENAADTIQANVRGKEEARSNDELEDVFERLHSTAQRLHSCVCRLDVVLEYDHQLAASTDQYNSLASDIISVPYQLHTQPLATSEVRDISREY